MHIPEDAEERLRLIKAEPDVGPVEPGWFAQPVEHFPAPGGAKEPPTWAPSFRTARGEVLFFNVHFPTVEECEGWIRDVVLPCGLLAADDDAGESP